MTRVLTLLLSPLIRRGQLAMTTPGGRTLILGRGEPVAHLTVRRLSGAWKLLRSGVLGFAEAYIDEVLDTPDLEAFLRWGAANHDVWSRSTAFRVLQPARRAWQRVTKELRHEKVDSMVDHYNIGNDFYSAWLDETMTYSSGRFDDGPDTTLADAQRAKYRAIAEFAGLGPGVRVLEIGCGWGGFAEFAALEYGAAVTALTVAEEQAEFAGKRMANAGVEDFVDIRLQDFRTVEGTWDAVVSIEMIESVDETVWPDLFAAFHDRVRPGGASVMQAIVIEDDLWEGYRRRRDFIQRYVFPGGQLPAPSVITSLAESNGLDVERIEDFGPDYARTLAMWRERFRKAWPALEPGFDERFRRMWELYLTYCQAGFETGRIDVQQWVFRRPEEV